MSIDTRNKIVSVVFIYGAVVMSLLLIPKFNLDVETRAQRPDAIQEDSAVVKVVRETSPAVVSIVATKDVAAARNANFFDEFCRNEFFRKYFNQECAIINMEDQPIVPETTPIQVGAGTGFLISSDGLIVTNKHVLAVNGASYTVILDNGKKYPASIVVENSNQDIAIIKIDAKDLQFLKLGDSDAIEIGQTAIAIGNALGQFSNTVSKGIISGLGRSIVAGSINTLNGNERLNEVIQTDAAINLGNSGGPLLNLSGEVIGINTAIVQGAQNIGFAIPINLAKNSVANASKSFGTFD